MNNYTSRTNRRHKSVVIACPSNILGHPSKYRSYTSNNLDGSPILPGPPSTVDNFFTLHLTKKKILNIKDVEFDFRMGCILVLFQFL